MNDISDKACSSVAESESRESKVFRGVGVRVEKDFAGVRVEKKILSESKNICSTFSVAQKSD